MQQLTNEEIARVFAMYLGCKVQDNYNDKIGKLIGIDLKKGLEVEHNIEWSLMQFECKLHLTPLASITDEHCIEIAKFVHTTNIEINELIQIGMDYINYNFLNITLNSIRSNKLNEFHMQQDIMIFQYLISKEYAVPLWFGVNHWANGLTAIELGIAVDKTNFK